MKKIILIIFCGIKLYGQQGQSPVTPLAKCIIPFTINNGVSGSAQGPFQPSVTGYDNRQTGCSNWSIVYSSTGYTVVSIAFQSAPALSNTAPGTPGTYVSFAGTLVSGINPNTATTQAISNFSGYYPWIRIQATLTGTGSVVGVLIGTLPISVTGGSASSGSGCVGTIATPCVVEQVGTATLQADGATNTPNIPTDATGVVITEKVYPFEFNGATWDKQFSCPSSAVISTSSSGLTQLVALAASKIIRVCNINWVSATPISVSLVYGTGSACATGETALTGIYANTTSVDFQFNGSLRTISANALCIKLGSAVSTTGIVTYAQF